MPLMMLDLDDSLIDRTAALTQWATGLVEALGRPPVDVDWIVAMDHYGTADRAVLASMINSRFELRGPVAQAVAEILLDGFATEITPFPGAVEAVDVARAAGWTVAVVTNGPTDQQQRKMRHTGLDQHVDATVISGAVGVTKPDRAIFALAAEQTGVSLTGAWMIGDSPAADIRGARAAGINSVWLHRGRSWPIAEFRPTLEADSCAAAIELVLSR